MISYKRLAYGKPRNIKGAGSLLNVGSRVGVKIVQLVYLRPPLYGYRKGRS